VGRQAPGVVDLAAGNDKSHGRAIYYPAGVCQTVRVERVVVVGAGVLGLTCAVRLLEAGHRVDVLARDLPGETTSAVAAALWYPYRALPQDRVTSWSAASYDEFARLAKEEVTGVRMLPGTEVLASSLPDPWWVGAVPDLTRTGPPAPYADAWTFTAPVIEMPLYLGWLARRVESRGGSVTRMNLSRLPEGRAPGGPVVVNCSGIGSRLLADDLSVTPVRGQVVLVEQVGLERWWLDSDGPTYVVPRHRDIVVGGTDDEEDWSRTPDPETAAAILRRATVLVPELAGAKVLRHKVGLRPVRPVVRLERVGGVVHCYGHGGAGVTLSWGCADEVAELVGAE
jgi:D-amino-acid oxidase